ncbi:MAG TPA: rhomboid family intramembrane serine protease [Pirellulales bacterium]|nr:rhomboid family intramembrane serine protease [Pirellulales bacterium]
MEPHDPYAPRVSDPYDTGHPRHVQPESRGDLDDDAFEEDVNDDDAYDDDADATEEPLELSADMLAEAPTPKRHDFERGMSLFPPLTIAIIVLLSIVFIWEDAGGALANQAAILKAGALQREAVLKGEVWRIFTSMHLHGSVDHLVGNCIGLFILGLAIEHAYGILPAIGLYMIGGIGAAVCCLVFEGGVTVGASGAIFAWWGAAVVFYYKYRQQLSSRDTRVGFVLLAWAAWTILTGLMSPQISNFSHIGGFLVGATMAVLTPTRLIGLRTDQGDVMQSERR